MKRAIVAFAILSAATAYAQTAHPYAIQKAEPVAQATAPSWFTKLPEDTPDMLFSVGVSTSVDEQMAYDKARLFAERKLVEMMSSQIKSLTKSHRSDSGDVVVESNSVTVQRSAQGELIGAQRVDSQSTYDGKRYRVYVLIRYPLAENNALRKEHEAAQMRREAGFRAARGHQDLERDAAANRAAAADADRKLKDEVGPRPEPISAVTQPVPAQAAEPIPNRNGVSLNLLDVDNEEYKRRRAEALAKPGAVIGRATLN
jgi:hypothetical protein